MNKNNTVYAIIIILILVILGIVSFHYYAFISAGDKSVLNAGIGAGFKFMPMNKNEHATFRGTRPTTINDRLRYCETSGCNNFTKANCPKTCLVAGCQCQ